MVVTGTRVGKLPHTSRPWSEKYFQVPLYSVSKSDWFAFFPLLALSFLLAVSLLRAIHEKHFASRTFTFDSCATSQVRGVCLLPELIRDVAVDSTKSQECCLVHSSRCPQAQTHHCKVVTLDKAKNHDTESENCIFYL